MTEFQNHLENLKMMIKAKQANLTHEYDEDESGTGKPLVLIIWMKIKILNHLFKRTHLVDEDDFTGDRIGVDFLGMSDYEDNISNDNQENYEDDESNDEKSQDKTGDKVGVDFLSELEELTDDDK